MSFLGQTAILKGLNDWIKGADRSLCRQASYDLRLGEDVYVAGEPTPVRLTEDRPYLTLKPGQFAILTTYESLAIPKDILGFITVRRRYKNQGLVNISGFHVDPTFNGPLKFAVQNVGPSDIHLKHRDATFSIFFARVEGGVGPRRETPGSTIGVDDVQLLGGSSVTLSQVKKDLDNLRQLMLVYAPFALGAFIALLVLIFKLFYPR